MNGRKWSATLSAVTLMAVGLSGTARADGDPPPSCPDGCTWTVRCEPMDYVCGQNPDGSFMWCQHIVCESICENCPPNSPLEPSPVDGPPIPAPNFPGGINPNPTINPAIDPLP